MNDGVSRTKQLHSEIMSKQDERLVELASITARIGEAATAVNEELRDQDQLLQEFDREIQQEQGRVRSVLVQAKRFLSTADSKTLRTIFTLAIIALLLTLWNIVT